MTAEVAILNRSGVALATDSMVTISGRETKSLVAARKIFQLYEDQPIAIMTYGAATFMGAAVAPIIAEFRKRSRKARPSSLENAAGDFTSFLATYREFDVDAKLANMHAVVSTSVQEFCTKTSEILSLHFIKGMPPFTQMFLLEVDAQIAELRASPFFEESETRQITSRYKDLIDAAVRPLVDWHGRKAAKNLAALGHAMIGSRQTSPNAVGYVVTGFGADDWEPSLFSYETDGWLGDKIKTVRREEDVVVDLNAGGALAPFAQTEMIRRYVVGADPRLTEIVFREAQFAIEAAMKTVYDRFKPPARTSKSISPADRRLWRGTVENAVRRLQERVVIAREDLFTGPVIGMISEMGIDDMAAYAEALIRTTILDQTFSDRHQSVGGAIQVATLTREDGFKVTRGVEERPRAKP